MKIRSAWVFLAIAVLPAATAARAGVTAPAELGEAAFGEPAAYLVGQGVGNVLSVPSYGALGDSIDPAGGEQAVSAAVLRALARGAETLGPDAVWGHTTANAFVLSEQGGIAIPSWTSRANTRVPGFTQPLLVRPIGIAPERAATLILLRDALIHGNQDGARRLTEQIAAMVDGAAKGTEASVNERGEVVIEPGEFWMGSRPGEGRGHEYPRHLVALTHRIAAHPGPLTRAAVRDLSGRYGDRYGFAPQWDGNDGRRDELPATHVSWFDGIKMMNAMSTRDGRESAYIIKEKDGRMIVRVNGNSIYETEGYRYPTEAELERMIRGGTTGPTWYYPDDDRMHRWSLDNAYEEIKVPGKTGHTNSWGIVEAVGNVWKWTHDLYAPYSGALIVVNPSGPDRPTREHGPKRVARGGSALDIALYARSASRYREAPTSRVGDFAVLPVRSVGDH